MASNDSIEVLSELRHVCKACGGSCQGTWVRLVGDAEKARIERLGEQLGVDTPVVDGRLRMEAGVCAVLDDDSLCSIHREYGAEAKPAVCQQYPLVAVRTDSGLRVGIDPGCYTHLATWREGPAIPDADLVATRTDLSPDQVPWEERLVDLCGVDDMTLARLLGVLTGEAPTDEGGLPPAFARRWIARLQQAELGPLLEQPETAPMLRLSIGPIIEAATTWDPEDPPVWPVLSDDEEAFAVDTVQRMVYLRLAHAIPAVAGVALLTAGGAIAAAWATGGGPGFGRCLAGWTRAIRAPAFWQAITPDAPAMQHLARGGADA